MYFTFFTFLACTAFLCGRVRAADYDTIIRNGRVVDGTGSPAFFADVSLKNSSASS